MGICAIAGPRVLHDDLEDGELSPRSTTSYGSASSQELDVEEAADHFGFSDGPLWQRTIPKGRRCKPLVFAGVISYDENGKQMQLTLLPEDAEDEEYYSPQPRHLAEEEFRSPE